MTTLYSYIVASDTGFAPNPFHCFCTLACCKPKIRTLRAAQKGDYVVGLSSKHSGNRLVYAMRITDKMTFDQYWNDSRFQAKRPNMRTGGIEALGDNIYHWDYERKKYHQKRSQHSNPDGTENRKHKHHDTKGDDHWVLISNDFVYWGSQGLALPNNLRGLILEGSNHRSKSNAPLVPTFTEWFNAQEKGRFGRPTHGLLSAAGIPSSCKKC